MAANIGVLIAVGAVLIIVLLTFIKANLIICPPNEVLIFSGRKRKLPDGTLVGYRAIRGGRGFRIPLVESIHRMSLNTVPIEFEVKKALTAGMIPVDVEGIATVKIAGSETQGLSNAIERFLGRGQQEIETVAKETIEGAVRGVLATLTPEDANAQRLDVAARALEAASEDLGKLGLVLDTMKVLDLSDSQGYLEAIGRKKNAEVLKNARVAEAENEAISREVAATASRDASVAEAEAQKQVVEAENSLRVRRAELEAESNRAEERSEVARAIARAEEERSLERVRVELNRQKYEAETIIPAEAEKQADELRAKGKAARILEDGRASAEALQLLSAQWRDGQGREVMLLQMLPKLLGQVTSVLNDNLHVERLTVLDSGSGGGLPDHVRGVTGSIVAVMEQLKNATGLDVADILQRRGDRGSLPTKSD